MASVGELPHVFDGLFSSELENEGGLQEVQNLGTVVMLCIDHAVGAQPAAIHAAAPLLNISDTLHIYCAFKSRIKEAAAERAVQSATTYMRHSAHVGAVHRVVELTDNKRAAILNYARDNSVDRIVLGIRERNAVQRMVLGSTADHLVKFCGNSSILLIRGPRADAVGVRRVGGLTYMLCADGSAHAKAAASHLLQALRPSDAVHLYFSVKTKGKQPDTFENLQARGHTVLGAAWRELVGSGRIGSDRVQHFVDAAANTREAILQYSRRHSVDVIVLGKRRPDRLGTTLGHVLHNADASLLVAHAAARLVPAVLAGLPRRIASASASATAIAPLHSPASPGACAAQLPMPSPATELNDAADPTPLTDARLRHWADLASGDTTEARQALEELQLAVVAALSSPSLLSASFLTTMDSEPSSPHACSEVVPLQDQTERERNVAWVADSWAPLTPSILTTFIGRIAGALETLVKRLDETPLAERGCHVHGMLVALELPILFEPECHQALAGLLTTLAEAVGLPPFGWPGGGEDSRLYHRLVQHWQQCPAGERMRLVTRLQQFLTVHVHLTMFMGPAVIACAHLLQLLHTANAKATEVLGADAFYNDGLSGLADMRAEYRKWRHGDGFSLVHYPFLLDVNAKSRLIQASAGVLKEQEISHAFLELLFFSPNGLLSELRTHLVLRVERDKLLESAASQLLRTDRRDLRKPLVVVFVGERAQDAGGPRKELFQLLFQELLSPQFGMFRLVPPEERLVWFDPHSPRPREWYAAVGILLGLAVYNNVIVNVNFPLAVFKYLLGRPLAFEDLEQVDGELYRGLRELLQFDEAAAGCTVEDTYCRTFTTGSGGNGGADGLAIPLKPNGESEVLTSANRAEFVELYWRHALLRGAEDALDNLAEGFRRAMALDVLQFVQPREMELIVCGTVDLEFQDLQAVTVYTDGFTKDTPVVQWFWEVALAMPLEQRQQLLLFATGSARVPPKGLRSIKFFLSRMSGDSDSLPEAHTCFNQLSLPEYCDKGKLKEKLELAIKHCEGFGMA
eukprot:TRINITY_DN2765_c0_g1_i1.p1 TRINITY_DN2765_c0_g1~~TRINITY_DN2765_c0_g1_i1.p1  ORF type:complete len:1039 (+),score=206.37 TRINITY_DN2765_c0_g1_i1:25-3117(+)